MFLIAHQGGITHGAMLVTEVSNDEVKIDEGGFFDRGARDLVECDLRFFGDGLEGFGIFDRSLGIIFHNYDFMIGLWISLVLILIDRNW